MKRIIIMISVMLLGMAVLAGCGRIEGAGGAPGAGSADKGTQEEAASQTDAAVPGEGVDIASLKTIGDALAIETDDHQAAVYEDTYVYVFKNGDTYYRVYAAIPEEIHKKLERLDLVDMDYAEKEAELVGPLEISKYENISEMMPSEEKLNEFVGKTGKDLLDAGWLITGYNVDEMQFFMLDDTGMFEYTVTVEGDLKFTDDFDEIKEIKPLKIKSFKFNRLADAATI